jgi:N-acetyl-anhydromuramyl-L-alanine amidase AmpD
LQTQTQQLQSQVQSLQTQLNGLQATVQQLAGQFNQLQSHVQQLASQPATPSVITPPVAAPPTITPPARPTPPIQNITNQLMRAPNQTFPTRSLNEIQLIVIHHTAVAPTVGADRIAAHRVEKQGWPGIGYHYFITGDGQIQQTNELTTEATHAGSYNTAAIGVCFAGDFTSVAPSAAQIEAGAQLLAYLIRQFNLSLDMVRGYKDLVNTQSPGNQWDNGARWGDTLRARIQAYL